MPSVVDPSSAASIREGAKRFNAQGILKAELESMSVRSFDLLMDPPHYDITLSISLYSAEGASLFQDRVQERIKSQSMTATGKGKAIDQLMARAVEQLEQRERFRAALDELRNP